uniref:DUF4283 domain-containing protein n=1 Tax=Cannabis sativa TaxID=3483 RepID=A0A803Q2T4_CANSA
MHSGFTLVSFKDEVTRNVILETGVIQFDEKPVILRPWSEDMDTARMVKSVPVWVRLNGLGLQYWGKKNLSALVSTIGKPIMADKVTLQRSMIKYARVLVDVEIKDEPPKTISFVNEKEQLVEQPIEYEWLPTKCAACDLLGHTVVNCNKGKPVIWRKNQQGAKAKPVKNNAEKEQEPPENPTAILGDDKWLSEGNLDVSEGNKVAEMISNPSSNETWVTPRKRGSKSIIQPMLRADCSNGYDVLGEVDGGLVTDLSIHPNG